MQTELKTRLQAARATLASLQKQGETANVNRAAILARRAAVENNQRVARATLERVELAHMRGLVAADQVQVAREGVAETERALRRQIADEETAQRACDFSAENVAAQAELIAARTGYFDAIGEHVAAGLRADTKLRGRLLSAWAAVAASQGRAPGEFERVNWFGVLEMVFPEPSAAEMQRAFSDCIGEHDAAR